MYIVRADGNATIGVGHLMRCLTIVEALVHLTGRKEDVLFVCADEASAYLVEEKGFSASCMGTDYQDMESELPFWERLHISRKQSESEPCDAEGNTILVDSYYVTEAYLHHLRKYGKVILLDDMQKQAFPVDVVVNYNVFAGEKRYRQLYQERNVQYCIGGKYVPVRPQFLGVKYQVADTVSDVLITTGGGDIDNIVGAILQKIYQESLNFHLVVGRFNPHLEELKQLALRCENVHIYYDVKDMAGLMQKCDLAITAGGTTIYELAAIGVPFICFSYAENQEALTKYIGEKEITYFAGAYHKDAQRTLMQMAVMVSELCEEKQKRRECNQKEKDMIDGMGAKRLAQVMLERNVSAH